jgi:GNAT superfamily N-acetyltransferase
MRARYYRVSRLVVLPDYQGIGVGKRLLNFIAELYTSPNKSSILYPDKQSPDNTWKHEKLENNPFWAREQGKRQHKNKQ